MRLAISDFGYSAGSWRVEKHLRFVTDITGDGLADVVGFGDGGVLVSRNTGGAVFSAPSLAVANFGFVAGGWQVDRHPRMLADVTGNGLPDIVGFGDGGVWVSRNTGNGTFAAPTLVVADFGFVAGGWRVDKHPRFVADLTGDGRGDIVGFGDGGVWVALNKGDGTFAEPTLAVADFGYTAGGWRVEKHPRFVADVTGDGRADIVGFGEDGVWVARNNGDGTFAAPALGVGDFGYTAGGWRVEKHPRFVIDVTGDERADIVGFGDAGVYVASSNGNGSFGAPKLMVGDFAYTAGGWRVDKHPRLLADLTGDGLPDIVGFGDDGVVTSGNNGGTFGPAKRMIPNFGYIAGGWRVDKHPRFVADLTGDHRADVAGCGEAGVWVELNRGDGTFSQTYVRHNIWDLEATGPWDPVTLAYAKAVKAMQARPLTDPTSWQYQAAIHGRNGGAPAGAIWNQCQHGSWYFLPWHRIYLYYFEKIVRAEVIAQGGPSDWALPFWDYEVPGQAKLPPAFRLPTMPDGSPNPLFVTQRGPGWNAGAELPPSVRSSTLAMSFANYLPPPAPGFGGGITTPVQFFGAYGELEFTPHNDVHSAIGGFMGDPNTAALDPIFWLHHANIDRLWSVWLGQGGGRANPGQDAWLNQSFPFYDETGTQVGLSVTEALDTVGDLEYVYQDEAQAVAPPAALAAEAEPVREPVSGPPAEPELVGATERPLDLTGRPATIDVVLDHDASAAAGDAAHAQIAEPTPTGRVYLNLEDIEGERNPSVVYEVFVGVAGAIAPTYVGNISFFGLERHGAAAPGEVPHGFRRTFDITSIVAQLHEQGAWQERLTVSLRPTGPVMPPGALTAEEQRSAAQAQSVPVRIGRISVFRD